MCHCHCQELVEEKFSRVKELKDVRASDERIVKEIQEEERDQK